MNDIKLKALAQHLKIKEEELVDEDHNRFSYGNQKYWVLTDEEADKTWGKYLDDYIDKCILDQLPATLRHYFDRDAWKDDAKHDGRGHSLSSYDGTEHETKIEGEWIYIYRVN